MRGQRRQGHRSRATCRRPGSARWEPPTDFPSGILADTLGLPDLPVTRVENSCATGNDAVRNALFGVASGACDVALVMGADKIRETSTKDMVWEWEAMARDMAWDYPLGLVSPAGFALHVTRYLHDSPATTDHMAMVAVKNHRHGVTNPKARLRFEITMEQALSAPTVVTPFRLYDCAPQSDGAAALVLAAEGVVDRFTDRPVWIRGVGLGLDSVMHQHKRDMTMFPATVRAAKQAFGMAGLTPSDVDVAEVHDFFTGIELMSYRGPRVCRPIRRVQARRGGCHQRRRVVAGEPQWGTQVEGASPGCDRGRTVRGTVRATPWGSRQPGRRRANRVGAQYRWPDRGVSGDDIWKGRGPMATQNEGAGPVDPGHLAGAGLQAGTGHRRVLRDVGRRHPLHLPAAFPVAGVPGAVLVRRPGLVGAALMVAIPLTVLVSFTLNILLRELGAADLSGAGAAFGAVTQVGPLVTVLIVAGAGATAMCADLGSRTIREEIDAMEVLGINPVQRLVTPRMLASGLVALLLNSLVVIIGILGGYIFSVFVQDVNPGCVRRRHHIAHRCSRADHLVREGGAVRSDRRAGRLLPRPDHHRRRREGRGQRRQRDGRLRVHGSVRRQRGGHRDRYPGDGEVMGDHAMALRATYPRLFGFFDQLPATGRDARPDRRSHHLLRQGDRRYARTRLIHFRREIIRLIAEISMGAGTLAMIGGTVVIVGFLTLAAGGTLAVQGYSSLGNIGIEALTGFLAAFINVRICRTHRRRHRLGGHVRCRRNRAARCHADQRGDRRT